MKTIQAKIEPHKHEAAFILLGRDRFAGVAMNAYAAAMEAAGVDPVQVSIVREHALEMSGDETLEIVVPEDPEIERPDETHGELETDEERAAIQAEQDAVNAPKIEQARHESILGSTLEKPAEPAAKDETKPAGKATGKKSRQRAT